MITLSTEAIVTYFCELTEQDEERVLKFAKESNISIRDAVRVMWDIGELNIYSGNVSDSDCNTQELYDIQYTK